MYFFVDKHYFEFSNKYLYFFKKSFRKAQKDLAFSFFPEIITNGSYNKTPKFGGVAINTAYNNLKNEKTTIPNMQQKLQKLFSFFKKIKNQPFYTSIISQIIQTYETCPQSLKFILYNLNQLIFTSTQQVKLRIKHRLICASIIAKLSLIYVNRIKKCVENNQKIDLQNFQLENQDNQAQNDIFKPVDQNQIWQKLDLFKIIETEQPLMSTKRQGTGQLTQQQQKNQNKIFEQYLNMNQATMMNIQQMFKDVKSDKINVQVAFQANKTKYQTKIEKIKKKQEQYSQVITLRICNPFNLLYQICVENLLNPQWQLRHLSALILKQLMVYPQFIGFVGKIQIYDKNIPRQQRFQIIQTQTKQQLSQFLKNNIIKNTIYNKVISLNLRLLCRDKFADYQSDQSNIIVRNKAAQTLARCYLSLVPNQQMQMLKRIKRIFDKEIKIDTKTNFTWEVKHSFMVFINNISQYPEQQLNVYKILQESMIKMLITQQQIDQIVYSICKCFKKFLGQAFFTQKQIQKVNEQIWKIVKNLDDISISTVSALQLLAAMFPYFNLNICNSLQQIRKFLISKIPEVRKQCYCLMKMLYQKKFNTTNDKQKKLIQSNIIQFLQASIVQYDAQIFEVLRNFSVSLFYQVRKERKIFQVVQFVTEVVLAEEFTEKIIETKFKNFQTFGLDKNDYLYIFEFEKAYISVDKYVDKRIWKAAEIVARGFTNTYQNFQDLVNAIQVHSKDSHRGKLFILHLLVRLVSIHKNQQYFTNFVKTASDLMKLDFTSVTDTLINEYKTYSQKTIKQLKQSSQQLTKKMQKIPTQLKNAKQIAALHTFLCEQLTINTDQKQKQLIQTEINVIQNLIEHQRTLFKQIKVLATCFYVKKEGITSEAINNVVSSIREALEEDRYKFLSQYGAETFIQLTNYLKARKVVLAKIVGSILTHISTKYEKKQLKISQAQNGYNLKADFMMGINLYIEKVVIHVPEWLQMFKDYFIVDFKPNQPKDPSLFLVSGTISSLIKICDKSFLQKLLEKLQKISEVTQPQNHKNLFDLLTKCFISFCQNYTEKSDIFYEWFLSMLHKGSLIFLQTLMKIGEQNIFKISSICCIFVVDVVKLLSQEKFKDIAMICLSNIVVGVYMNNKIVNFGQKLQTVADQGIQFVKNFRDASNFEYKNMVRFKKDIELRNYQKEGIQWLGFLTKFNLNGALCDDMGLGKTLQVFVLMENQYLKDMNANAPVLHSLIVAPTTLTEHWSFEYNKYFEKCICKPVLITTKSTAADFEQKKQKGPIIFITSYQILQKKIEQFESQKFKFIILDQGHIIKNPKTNKFLAVKKLIGQHRFILTGTPIQNRLKQLWSLFDFLMPGYLYSKQLFKSHYEKLFEVNLTTFKEDQLLFTDQQKKILQKLHLKVMPFIMRRMKSQVLKQLPQKIINDYYCEMTQTQQQLYSQFQNQNHKITKGKNQQNILSSLSKMRKILNHPNLIGKEGNYETSGKFVALNQLFEQLGFREDQSIIQNKAIVFSRSTSTIQLIEKLFMKVLYPKLKYTKLTASVKPNQRFMVAQNFNGDNDIKVLLVTTAVGGQGLNLTSANTIIMFDHDYNPTVDMQAIDRAHRIGQKRVLNVYRLITRNTLQQRIMGIQKFKKNLAQAIVNIDNSSIRNIQDSKLPQLLQNMKDLQQKQKKEKIKKSFYNKLVEQMQHDAIAFDDYDKQY